MRTLLVSFAILLDVVPSIAACQEARVGVSERNGSDAGSVQVLEGHVVAPEERPRRRGLESGFFRWGLSPEVGAVLPIGDRGFTFDGVREFTPAFDVGFDLAFDVGRHVQIGFVTRFGFGGVDSDIYADVVRETLGYVPSTMRSTVIQSGARLRVFPFEVRHFRPFLLLETVYTTMGVNARHEVQGADADADARRETVFSYRYSGASVAPGAGLRYDVGLRARPGFPRYSRLLSVYVQASYCLNLWSRVRLDVEGVASGEAEPVGLDLAHVRITAGAGVMF